MRSRAQETFEVGHCDIRGRSANLSPSSLHNMNATYLLGVLGRDWTRQEALLELFGTAIIVL